MKRAKRAIDAIVKAEIAKGLKAFYETARFYGSLLEDRCPDVTLRGAIPEELENAAVLLARAKNITIDITGPGTRRHEKWRIGRLRQPMAISSRPLRLPVKLLPGAAFRLVDVMKKEIRS